MPRLPTSLLPPDVLDLNVCMSRALISHVWPKRAHADHGARHREFRLWTKPAAISIRGEMVCPCEAHEDSPTGVGLEVAVGDGLGVAVGMRVAVGVAVGVAVAVAIAVEIAVAIAVAIAMAKAEAKAEAMPVQHAAAGSMQ